MTDLAWSEEMDSFILEMEYWDCRITFKYQLNKNLYLILYTIGKLFDQSVNGKVCLEWNQPSPREHPEEVYSASCSIEVL